jgi:hypothetical protein
MQAAHNQDPACFRTALPVMINSGQICSVDRDNSQLDLAIEYDGARDVLGLPGVDYSWIEQFWLQFMITRRAAGKHSRF